MHSVAPHPLNGSNPGRQRRKASRPGELLEAALELFVERGYSSTKTEDVAARAGVSKGTLYRYFSTKEELFKAVVRHNLSVTLQAGEDLVDTFRGSTPDLLGCIAQGWWERVGQTQAAGIFRLMMTEMGNFPALARFYAEEVIEPGQRLIARILRRGIDQGEFREVDVFLSAKSLIFPMLLLCMHQHSFAACGIDGPANPAHDAPALLANHVDLLVRGLMPRDGDAS